MLDIYVEYLSTIGFVNLIIRSKQHQLREQVLSDDFLELVFSNESKTRIHFVDFKANKTAIKVVKQTDDGLSFESILRFQVANYAQGPLKSNIKFKENKIRRLRCLNCDVDLLKPSQDIQGFNLLSMPESELDELADNFFCHLHDCDHHHDHDKPETDLTNVLNPLRNAQKLRKSVLYNSTLFVLNINHVSLESIVSNENSINCSNCKFNLGYRNIKRHPNDFFIWKSNTLLNEASTPSCLISELEQGRYKLDTFNESSFIYLWVMSDNCFFKHYNLNDSTTGDLYLRLSEEKDMCKKATYQLSTSKELHDSLQNDINVSNFEISIEQYSTIAGMLESSNQALPTSLKGSNELKFAIFP